MNAKIEDLPWWGRGSPPSLAFATEVVDSIGTNRPNVVLPPLELPVEVEHFVVPVATLLLVLSAYCPYCR